MNWLKRVSWPAIALGVLVGIPVRAVGASPKRIEKVVVLVPDQLRATRLHCYGNPRETSPNIDRLAARGIRFTHFYTVGSWTTPSFAALFTGLYPSRMGANLFGAGLPLVTRDTPVLTESFRDHGYYTTAYVNNTNAGKHVTGKGFREYYDQGVPAINITERYGLDRFGAYRADRTTPRILEWLERHRNEPFFLYVHYWEPHSPYDPPAEDDIFKSDAYPHLGDEGWDVVTAPLKRLAMLGDAKALERLYQLYDGKIHHIDRYIGQIMDKLRDLGLEEQTLVVLSSDHGELMFSHPRDYLTADHVSLYDANVHIPLIIAGPGVPSGQVTDALASNVDTAQTILELAGLPLLTGAAGRSLAPLIRGEVESVNDYVFAEQDAVIPCRSVRDSRFKLIYDLQTGHKQLFDLAKDPDELVDVATENPKVVERLFARLRDHMSQNEPSEEVRLRRLRLYGVPGAVATVDDQTIGAQMLLTGQGWHSDTSVESGNFQMGCFWSEPGDGSRTAVWRPSSPMLGDYRILVYAGRPPVGKLASNAPFTITTETGTETVRVNFNERAGEWRLLGTFTNPRFVTVTNAADGIIVVDAVRFERL
jgi:arylsulfatase A-like enzyme